MQPLKARGSSSSPVETVAIELLRTIDRYQPPLGQKQRVRIRLLEHATPQRVLIPWPALTVVMLLVAAGASAALGGRWLKHRQTTTLNADRAPQSGAAIASITRRGPEVSSALKAPQSDEGVPWLGAASAEATSLVDSHARADRVHESIPRVTPSNEKLLVFDAMRALRREGRPERAAKLLDEYLRRYPEGSLAEEALALDIEASTALSDPRAKTLADRYLARYPEGRFRSAAERARTRFAQ